MYPFISFFDGKFRIPTYSLMFMLGFVLALIIIVLQMKKSGTDYHHLLYGSIYALIGIGVGAKLMFFISKLPTIIARFDVIRKYWDIDPMIVLTYAFGGLVFYGGLIGALFGFYIYHKQYHVSLDYFLYYGTPFLPFIHGFGRIGCFLGGCCYGREYYGPFAVTYPYSENDPELSAFPRFPTQLTEALYNFCLFAFLLILRKKNTFKEPSKYLGVYLICYAVERFLIEFLRGDAARGVFGALSTSQIVSIPVLAFGLFLLLKKEKKVEEVCDGT